MALFEFQAKALDGKFVKGELDANNETEARIRIRAQKLVPLRVVPKAGERAAKKSSGGFSLSDKVAPKDLQIFTRQFAVLISAGVPVVQSLEALVKGARSPVLARSLSRVLEDVAKGKRLADALSTQPKVFDRLYVNLVWAGEEGGVLDTVLNRLAEYIEKSVKLRGKVTGALFYPAAIILVAIAVIGAIMVFVIPKLSAMFMQVGQDLPALTKMVIQTSQFCQSYWYVLVAVIVGIPVLLKTIYETDDGRKTLDAIIIDLPVFGGLVQKSAIARFSRTLSTLLGAGVRIVDSLDIAGSTSGNWVIEKAIKEAKDSISKGKTLADPLGRLRYMPNMVVQMISVGEQTGNLDQMLGKIADFYEDEVETAAEAMTSMIEPLLMVFLGGVIAVIVIAMYLPIFNLAGAVTG